MLNESMKSSNDPLAASTGDIVHYPFESVHGLFEKQVHQNSTKTAIEHGDRQLTYAELNQQANQLAHFLRKRGLEKNEPVGVFIERSPELFISLLATLKADGAYLPLDTGYPEDRIAYMLEHAQTRFVLTTGTLASKLPPAANIAHIIQMDKITEHLQAELSENLNLEADTEQLAYLIYTSGSTGNPKGVAMPHQGLNNMLQWHANTRPASSKRRTLQFCAVSFDFSFHEIFSTLCYGGTLVLIDETTRRDPFALATFVHRQAIERLFLPVTALQQWTEAIDDASMPYTVNEVITTGEQLRITDAMKHVFGTVGASLHNHYGATEFQDATFETLSGDPAFWDVLPSIGRPLHNVQVYILDEGLKAVESEVVGELYIGGAGLAHGYYLQEDLTKERFIQHPQLPNKRIYRTGDLAKMRPDGRIENLGRVDFQVKIRGKRVELGEIEAVIARHDKVRETAVVAHDIGGIKYLVAYVVPHSNTMQESVRVAVKNHAMMFLPEYMHPDAVIMIDALPLTPSGKIDRRALVLPERFERDATETLHLPESTIERRLVSIWQNLLHLDHVGVDDNFFDIGGTSLLLVQMQKQLREEFNQDLPVISLFDYPTIRSTARYLHTILANKADSDTVFVRDNSRRAISQNDEPIAIIGLSGRFPGADSIDEFWHNLRNGVESIEFFDNGSGDYPSATEEDANFVFAAAPLNNISDFDAQFFGISPQEARLMDPQQRIFLECAWESLEHAGYASEATRQVGIFAGSSMSTYLLNNLSPALLDNQVLTEADMLQFQLKLGNDRNYLPMRVSYKLNLTGPSINVQTACSTSLVAVHLACEALRRNECELALAGGVSVTVPQRGGYLHEDGMIRSRDGHCRAFDADASGTLFGSGCGIVVLKRLSRAEADNDHILAVIRGSAVNNDGSQKVGFTAPSAQRQTHVILKALQQADIKAEDVSYVEAHGTGTVLGDPIEIMALTHAYYDGIPEGKRQTQYCAIGSVKTNIGHLDEAAGIAGLIKATLALHHRQIPASLNFKSANPKIDFSNSPFYVVDHLQDWDVSSKRRIAGVSSFGMGGTNCHVVLEEAPLREATSVNEHPAHILTISARNQSALRDSAKNLANYLANHSEHNTASICFSANVGRHHFEERIAVVGNDIVAIQLQLERIAESSIELKALVPAPQKIAWLFTGQGAQYPRMGAELYEHEPAFRQAIEACAHLTDEHLELPLQVALFSDDDTKTEYIHNALYTQVGLFAVEYALAQLWLSWGVQPDVVMGHSLGEYVAACVAGILTLEDALRLVLMRGKLMQDLPSQGGMISVRASASQIHPYLMSFADDLSFAAINGPNHVVISGQEDALAQIKEQFTRNRISYQHLEVSHAFHSPLMDEILDDFAQLAQEIDHGHAQISFVSNLNDEPTLMANHWVDHIRLPVLFEHGISKLVKMGVNVFMEIGPKPVLLGMAQSCLKDYKAHYLPSLRPERPVTTLFNSVASLYRMGYTVDWTQFEANRGGQRIPLHHYPWQRVTHWIERPKKRRNNHKDDVAPLLGKVLSIAGREVQDFQAHLCPSDFEWLLAHRIFEQVVLPGVAYLDMIFSASLSVTGQSALRLRHFLILQAMSWQADELRCVQTSITSDENQYDVSIFSQLADAPSNTDWLQHVSAQLFPITTDSATAILAEHPQLESLQAEIQTVVLPGVIFEYEQKRGIDLGTPFQVIEQVWIGSEQCLTQIRIPYKTQEEKHQVHPCLLESCFLTLTMAYPDLNEPKTYVPFSVDDLVIDFRLDVLFSGSVFWCFAQLHEHDLSQTDMLKANIYLYGENGQCVLQMQNVVVKLAEAHTMLNQGYIWADWLYRLKWIRQTPGPTALVSPDKTDVVIISEEDWIQDIALAFQSQGITYHQVVPDTVSGLVVDDNGQFRINPQDKLAWQALAQHLPEQIVIIYQSRLQTTDLPFENQLIGQCQSLLHLAQMSLTKSSVSISIVTRGAQSILPDEGISDLASSALWGFGRVLMLEHPELHVKLLDLDTGSSVSQQVQQLIQAYYLQGKRSAMQQTAWRGGEHYVARLMRHHVENGENKPLKINPDSDYLITGGRGALGILLAEHLIAKGVRRLHLVGRSPANAYLQLRIASLQEQGAEVFDTQLDVSDGIQVANYMNNLPNLRGIFHLAGILEDRIVINQTPESIERVMMAKAISAWNLEQHSHQHDLDFFVMFSSISSLLGSAGQANYAAANAVLDALSQKLKADGRVGLSINWGSWDEIGMSAEAGLTNLLIHSGEGVIPLAAGLEALTYLMEHDEQGQVAVLPADWQEFAQEETAINALVEHLRKTNDKGSQKLRDEQSLRQQLEVQVAPKRRRMLEFHIQSMIGQILGYDETLPVDAGLQSLGVDSLGSIELRNKLQNSLMCQLPATFVFDHPTIAQLCDYLLDLLFPETDESADQDRGEDDIDVLARRLAKTLGIEHILDDEDV